MSYIITSVIDYYYYRLREKARNETKIRKLAIADVTSKPEPSHCCYVFIKILVYTATALAAILFIYAYHQQLFQIYQQQLNYYMYGANKHSWQCRQPFAPEAILHPLSNQLVAQSSAIAAIDTLLWRHHNAHVTGIVLAGGSGVGKSLTASIFLKNWQWQRNLQSISITGADISQFKGVSEKAYQLLNDCGHNLIVVDNMQSSGDIAKFHWSLLLQLTGNQTKYKVIVVYVINLASYTDGDVRAVKTKIDQLTKLSEIDGLTVVPYAGIDENGLRDCIRLECERTGVLDGFKDEQMQIVVQSIDVKRSGCKHVHTKVALYA